MSINDLQDIYEEYDRAYGKAVQKAPAAGGLLGMGDSPKNAPCHDDFYEKVAAWVADFSSGDAAEAARALDVILKAAAQRRGKDTYWYCYAAQGHGEKLVGLLTPGDAAAALAWYEAEYPAIDRMPVQQRLVKRLEKQAKSGAGPSLFRR